MFVYLTGEEMRKKRIELGFSLDDLAKAAGVSKGYISQYENGKATLSEKTMNKICAALGFAVASSDDDASAEVKIARLRADMKSGELSVEDRLKYAESIELDERDRDPRRAGDLYLIKAELYREVGRYPDAVRSAVEAEEIFARGKEVLSYCKALYEHGRINYDRGDFSDSIERFKLVERKMIGIPFQNDFMVNLYTYTAMAYSAVRDRDGVDMYVAKSESQMAFASPSEIIITKGHHSYLTATRLFELGSYDDAITAYQKAQAYYDELNIQMDSLTMRQNVVQVLCITGRFGEAEEKVEALLGDQIKASAKPRHLIRTQLWRGRIAYNRGREEEAIHLFIDIIKNENATTYDVAYARWYLADIELKRGNLLVFNQIMTSIIQELSQSPKFSHLAVQFMSEYMKVNHPPDEKTP